MDLARAEQLARSLMDEHCLRGWRVEWDRAVRRAGLTRFRDRTISLSRHLTALHPDDEVRETILHEIAHALVGPGHGHDAVWRRTAIGIGASGRRCVDLASATVEGRWRGVCPSGHVASRHRVPVRVVSCRQCSPRFDLRYVYTWSLDGGVAPMHPRYAAELAHLTTLTERQPVTARTGAASPAQAGPLVPVGERVRITAVGRFHGRVGIVTARRRTRYAVQVREGVLAVPFALVESA